MTFKIDRQQVVAKIQHLRTKNECLECLECFEKFDNPHCNYCSKAEDNFNEAYRLEQLLNQVHD